MLPGHPGRNIAPFTGGQLGDTSFGCYLARNPTPVSVLPDARRATVGSETASRRCGEREKVSL